jgi:hypothetical protein
MGAFAGAGSRRWARVVLDVASRRRAAMTHWLERLAENHEEYLSRPR